MDLLHLEKFFDEFQEVRQHQQLTDERISNIMATLSDVQASLANLTTTVAGISTDVSSALADITTLSGQVTSLQQQLTSGGTVSPSDLDSLKATIDGLTSKLTTVDSSLQQGMAALNPTPAPGPSPAPAPSTGA